MYITLTNEQIDALRHTMIRRFHTSDDNVSSEDGVDADVLIINQTIALEKNNVKESSSPHKLQA